MTTTPTDLSPAEVQKRIRKTEREIARLEKTPDPGHGHPLPKARALRERHLHALETATVELESLRAAWQAGDPKTVERESMLDRLRRAALRKTIAEAQTPEDTSFLRTLHESMLERERERDQARARADAEDLAAHPGDPRADSVIGAVMADPILLDACEHKLRPIEGTEGEFSTEAVLDASDLGALCLTLHLLGQRRPVVIEGWGQAARFQRREHPILAPENLRPALVNLRRAGFLHVEADGGQALVDYGPETVRIAARWGLDAS